MRFLVLFLTLLSFQSVAQSLSGAWRHTNGDINTIILASDKYISVTEYKNNEFIKTWGGPYETQKSGQIFIDIDFNSSNQDRVTTKQTYMFKLKKKKLEFNNISYEKIGEDKPNALTGLWVITGRANPQGEMSKITPGARRTYKLMAGGYFQWLAINIKNGEFSGTGGGKYTLENGKYTEHIEFFSRDNGRVGAELSFEASVSGNEWTHSGKSSKGEPIKEVWSKAENFK